MKKLISLFVKYPFYAKIFIVATFALGVISFMSMNKSYFPITESKSISISVSYQGATPKEMEEGVVTLVENSLRGIPGIKEYSSSSQENSASVRVTVKNGYDIDKVVFDIKNAVDAISNFPSGAERPRVVKSRTTTPAFFFSLKANYNDPLRLKSEAQRIEDEIIASGAVSQVFVRGVPSRLEMSVEVDEQSLQKYGLTTDEIKNAIVNFNKDIYGGMIQSDREQVKINLRNRSVEPQDIENIVVLSNPNGSVVRIKDLGKVIKQFEDTPSESYLDGECNIFFRVMNLKEENLGVTSDYLKQYIKDYNESHTDTQIVTIRDMNRTLSGTMNILYGNGISGIILVVIALSMFLSIRTSLWVAWNIPMSFLCMAIVANLMGVSINMISTFGMILVIGIVVDNGIVISENIYSRFERGESPSIASIRGTMEMLPSIIVSVITTIVAFLPILFIEGNLEMMYDMAIIVILCLTFSMIEAIFILPSHLSNSKVLSKVSPRTLFGKLVSKIDKGIKWITEHLYVPYLQWVMTKKSTVIAAILAMFIVTIGLFMGGRIGFVFFPSSNVESFTIDLAMKPGTSKERTLEVLNEMAHKARVADTLLAKETGEELFITNINTATGRSFQSSEIGEHAGDMDIYIRRLDESKVSSDEVQRKVSQVIGDVPEAYKSAVGAGSRWGAPVSISLFDRNSEELFKASSELKAELNKREALYNIIDNNQLGNREVLVKLTPLAYSLGLNPQTIMNQIRGGFYGSLAQRVQDGRDEVWFYVRYPLEGRKNISDLKALKVRTSDGGEYPLGELCEFENQRSVTKINHYNGKKELRVEAFMKDSKASITPVFDDIKDNILPTLMDKYPGLTYEFQGQYKSSGEDMDTISIFFSIAFLIIALILFTYLRSFSQGIIILLMIPLSFVAAVWGHIIENTTISMMSIWGMVALSGTIVNNAVVYISRYNDALKEGKAVVEAIIDAGRNRLRPILLTSATTTIGLFPLIRETSSDAQFVLPIAISLGYGILIGTFFVLLFFPVLIKCTNVLSLMRARMFGDKNATPESVEVAIHDKVVSDKIDEELNQPELIHE